MQPLGLMHCDKMTIFSRRCACNYWRLLCLCKASALTLCSLKGEQGARAKRNLVGLGLIVALASFAWGRENGCRKAEMLAINDDGALDASDRFVLVRPLSTVRLLQKKRTRGWWRTTHACSASRKCGS